MTYKEKLMMDHPDYIDPRLHGNCCGCPSGYGYCSEDENLCKIRGVHTGDEKICTECWNREMPAERMDKSCMGECRGFPHNYRCCTRDETKVLSLISGFITGLDKLGVSYNMNYSDECGIMMRVNGRRKDNEEDNK